MRKFIFTILFLICLGVFGYSAFQLYQIYSIKHAVNNEVQELEKTIKKEDDIYEVDWDSLKEKNNDIIGWILMPDSEISFPIVQGQDNSYYLNHTYLKEENRMGSIFLNEANQSDFSDVNSIIYGHSVDTGGMFTSLKEFKDETYYQDHSYFYLLTPQQNYKCSIVCFSQVQDGCDYYLTNFDITQMMSMYQNTATHYTQLDSVEKVVTLSTCDLDYGGHSSYRFVLVASLEKYDGLIKVA